MNSDFELGLDDDIWANNIRSELASLDTTVALIPAGKLDSG